MQFHSKLTLAPDESSPLLYTHLSSSDDALIAFLWDKTDDMGRNVLDMIRKRKLFKRITVLSYRKEDTDAEIFKSIYDRFRQERLRGDLQRQEEYRLDLENNIIDIYPDELREVIIEEKEKEKVPFILLDVPLKALRDPLRKEAFWYVPEEQLGYSDTDTYGNYSVAESKVQIERTAFDMDVGKIRVLVHPLWVNQIKAHISTKQIKALLTNSC